MKKVSKLLLCLAMLLLSAAIGGVSGFFAARFPQTEINAQPSPSQEVPEEGAPPSESPEPAETSLTAADIARQCTKSVVNIEVETVVKGYTGGSAYSKTELAHGTGVAVRENGYIVTCYHLVEDAEKITVVTDDKTSYPGELVGYDESFDLAVIHVDTDHLDAAALGDSDALQAGESVVIIGNPLGELGFSVSAGILSATEREISIEGVPLRLLQTDAAVNPGNSGGGMFDMRGRLIGVVNAKMSAAGIEGLGFAIPLNTIQEKIDAIVDGGEASGKAVLGVSTKSAVCYPNGESVDCVEITSVRSGGAAEKAGLLVGDYLLSANGKPIESNDDLVLIVKYSKPGDEITFEVFRNSKKITVKTTLT